MVYNIPDLDAGTLYYVRVSAVSSVGTSDSTLAANNPVAPSQHPDAPADITAEAVIGSGLELNSEIEVGGASNRLAVADKSLADATPHKGKEET